MLPNNAHVLDEWEQPVILKTVTTTTVDFEPVTTIDRDLIMTVVQPASPDSLRADTLDWSRLNISVWSKTPLDYGQLIQYRGRDYKVIIIDGWNDYGYIEVVCEETKAAVL